MSSNIQTSNVNDMPTSSIAIMICTINSRIENVVKKLIPQLDGCQVCIAHQITDGVFYPDIGAVKGVKYLSMNEAGLSRNRNLALRMAQEDIAVICDDDVSYVDGFVETIKKTYAEHTDADIIIFGALNTKGEYISKASRKGEYWHDRKTILSVCSIMITFKTQKIKSAEVIFDEAFGIGSTWCVGEEAIFLKDALDKGLMIWNCSVPIVIHDGETTGTNYNVNLVKSRPAVFVRLFGPMAGLLSVVNFTLFHFPLYRKKFNPFNFLWLSLLGYNEYLRKRK